MCTKYICHIHPPSPSPFTSSSHWYPSWTEPVLPSCLHFLKCIFLSVYWLFTLVFHTCIFYSELAPSNTCRFSMLLAYVFTILYFYSILEFTTCTCRKVHCRMVPRYPAAASTHLASHSSWLPHFPLVLDLILCFLLITALKHTKCTANVTTKRTHWTTDVEGKLRVVEDQWWPLLTSQACPVPPSLPSWGTRTECQKR
jgi:hypothetical protein